ncbi:MAG: hypothetical protein IJT34_08765 [Butyrivibrio sp.]|nr:hypothetical protein [Butyrivibrio sp.]
MDKKKIGRRISLCMAFILSLCLSLTGNLTSGHFTVPGFLISFVLSFVISLVIGFFIPMGPLAEAVSMKLGCRPHSLPARLVESLVSDLIYTPVITLAMVGMAWRNATAQGAQIPFVPMFVRSLLISLVVAYVLIFLLQPVIVRMILRSAGVPGPDFSGQPGRRG